MRDIVISVVWGLCIFLNFLSASINYQLDSSSTMIFNICMAIFCIAGLMIHVRAGGYYDAFNERITNQILDSQSNSGSKKEKEKKDQEDSQST